MADRNYTTPDFEPPKAEDLFLASRFGLRTYGDLKKFEQFFLQFLLDYDHNVKKAIGFLSHSSDELIFAIAACWRLGIPFICFNPKSPQAELDEQINLLNPDLIFADKENFERISPKIGMHIHQLDIERTLATETSPSAKAIMHSNNEDPEQVFGYFFTSGTTDKPKIVPLKRRQMYFAAESSSKNFKPRPNHFWLLCLPLNHIGGVSIILRSLLYGSGIYRMNRFDTEMVTTFLSENNLFQAASLVPTMLKRLLDDPVFRTHNNFKAILLGGGPVDSELLELSTQRGIPLVSSYGMTETCAQIAANPLMEPSGVYRPIKSVGDIFKPNEVEIRDEHHEKLGVNNSGTIWIKGPQVFDGYLNPEEPNLSFDEGGWFNTGDFGYFNANGHLFIESRRTDLIITGGENVSPFEVETELEKIEPISEAAVLGLEDKEWGQQVVAVVVAKTKDKLKAEDIQDLLKSRITPHKVPKRIIQADTLPRTESGKVKRTELAKLFK